MASWELISVASDPAEHASRTGRRGDATRDARRAAARTRLRRGAGAHGSRTSASQRCLSPSDQRRKALQPDVSSLSRRRWPGSHRGHAARRDRRVPPLPRGERDSNDRHHRRRTRASSCLPRHRPARTRDGPPRDGSVQPHDHPPAQLPGLTGVFCHASRGDRRVASLLRGPADRRTARRRGIRLPRFDGSTSSDTVSTVPGCY